MPGVRPRVGGITLTGLGWLRKIQSRTRWPAEGDLSITTI